MRYEYECPKDGTKIEIERSILESESIYTCELCGTQLKRIYNSPPIKFNATGFYTTDKGKR